MEIAVYGMYFEVNEDIDYKWKGWFESKYSKDWPNLHEVKETLKKILMDKPLVFDEQKAVEIVKDFVERRSELNKYVHTLIGGEIEKVILGDEYRRPSHTWSAYFDLKQLQEWYVNFIKDMSFLGTIIISFWLQELEEDKKVNAQMNSLVRLYEDIKNRKIVENLEGNKSWKL